MIYSMGGSTPSDTQGNTYSSVLTVGNLKIWQSRISSTLDYPDDIITVTGSVGFVCEFWGFVELDQPIVETWDDTVTAQAGNTYQETNDTVTLGAYYNRRIYCRMATWSNSTAPWEARPPMYFREEGVLVSTGEFLSYENKHLHVTRTGGSLVLPYVGEGFYGDMDLTAEYNAPLSGFTLTSNSAVLALRGVWGKSLSMQYMPYGKCIVNRDLTSNDLSEPYVAYRYSHSGSLLGSVDTGLAKTLGQTILRLRDGRLQGNSQVSRDGGVSWSDRKVGFPPFPGYDPPNHFGSVAADPSSGYVVWTDNEIRPSGPPSPVADSGVAGFLQVYGRTEGFAYSGAGTYKSGFATAPSPVGYCADVKRRPDGTWDILYSNAAENPTQIRLLRIRKLVLASDPQDALSTVEDVGLVATGYQMATSAYDPSRRLVVFALWKVTEDKWYVCTADPDLDAITTPTLLCSSATRAAELHRRADGVWEFVYADTSNTIRFLQCRSLQSGSNGSWA